MEQSKQHGPRSEDRGPFCGRLLLLSYVLVQSLNSSRSLQRHIQHTRCQQQRKELLLAKYIKWLRYGGSLSLYLLDVETKPDQHDPNREQRHSQPDATIIALGHRFLARLQILGGNIQARLDILIH